MKFDFFIISFLTISTQKTQVKQFTAVKSINFPLVWPEEKNKEILETIMISEL